MDKHFDYHDKNEYAHLVTDICDVIKLESLHYCNRYYDVYLKSVVFARSAGQTSFSLQGIIVSGYKYSYWFSQRHEEPANTHSTLHAYCISIGDIRKALRTGKINDQQVFL